MFPSRPPRHVGRFNLYDRPYPIQLPAVLASIGRSNLPAAVVAPPAPPAVPVSGPPATTPPLAPITINVPGYPEPPAAPAIVPVPYRPPTPVAPPSITVPAYPPVKPSIGGDPDIVDPSPKGCPIGPYLALLTQPQRLDVSTSPRSAVSRGGNTQRTATAADVTVPAGLPILATAADITAHRDNRHTCDFRLPLASALNRIRKALPTHPWWGWLASNPTILETMVMVNSGGIWNAVAPCEDYRAYKGSTRARFGCSLGLFQINEFYAAPIYGQANATLGSCSAELVTSPSATRTLSQLAKYNEDPGRFAWARALCARPEGVVWGCLSTGFYIRQFAVYVNPLTGEGRGAYKTQGLTSAVSIAKKLKPKLPGAVWLRAMWIGGTVAAASKLIVARDDRLMIYLNAL